MENKNAVNVINICKTYKNNNKEQIKVFDKFNAQFEQNKIHCLLGVSGSGKSSLLKLIAGLEKKDCGDIMFLNKSIEDNLAMIFQDNNLFPWLTVYQNINLLLKSYYKRLKIKKTKKQIDEEIEKQLSKYDLIKYKNFYPNELYGGLNQKVTLVKTLITNPLLILFDESFSALDFLSKEMIYDFLISDFNEKKYTAIITTHDVKEAVVLSDYIHIINKGSYIKVENMLPKPRVENEEFQKLYNKIKELYKTG